MGTLSDLPVDVVTCFLRIAMDGVSRSLSDWKDALPLISVCHTWRVAGLRSIYQCAFIDVRQVYFQSPRPREEVMVGGQFGIEVLTNIPLVMEVRAQELVRHLGLYRFDLDQGPMLLMKIVEALSITMSECAEIQSLRVWLTMYAHGRDIHQDVVVRCREAAVQIAAAVFRRLPRVAAVSADMYYSGTLKLELMRALIGCYSGQLTNLDCRCPAYFDEDKEIVGLVDLHMQLRPVTRYHAELPLVNPARLRRVRLVLSNIEFGWDMFCSDGEQRVRVEFNRLEQLYLEVDGRMYGAEEGPVVPRDFNYGGWELAFPRLTDLTVRNLVISPADAEGLFVGAPRLRRLHYRGPVGSALLLCKQDGVGRLEELVLDLEPDGVPEPVDGVNAIFRRTHGIGIVRGIICWPQQVTINTRAIDWPYLTHLSISAKIRLDELLVAMQAMPNLVELEADICVSSQQQHTEAAVGCLVGRLKDMRQGLSCCKLEKLVLRYDARASEPLNDAIRSLALYMPQLRTINVPRVRRTQ
ncbi:hypothetical protein GGF46_002133 [Coemansia sp. RSA 552]|nr:hypothetical protein GGF46_002133 [Coemansia sp. RSA 552]